MEQMMAQCKEWQGLDGDLMVVVVVVVIIVLLLLLLLMPCFRR